jgi:hypothetical protein
MTAESVGGRSERRKTPRRIRPRQQVNAESLSIGETDANIFNCPVCSRPLATGVHRCPTCGTRLLLSTPASRVGIFVSAGVVLGLLFGWSFSAVAGALTAPRATTPTASHAPGASAPVIAVPPTPAPTVPAVSRSALGQAAALDARLASAISTLRLALRDKDLDSAAVADQLRSLAADAAFGDDLASRLGMWDQAYALSLDLSNLYGSIRSTAREGLAASIQNDPAYRASAQKMLAVLAGIAPLDKRLRDLAMSVDIRLPGASPSDAPH